MSLVDYIKNKEEELGEIAERLNALLRTIPDEENFKVIREEIKCIYDFTSEIEL